MPRPKQLTPSMQALADARQAFDQNPSPDNRLLVDHARREMLSRVISITFESEFYDVTELVGVAYCNHYKHAEPVYAVMLACIAHWEAEAEGR